MEPAKKRELKRNGASDLANEVAGMMHSYDLSYNEKWEPRKLNSMHRKIIALLFTARYTQPQIAEMMGVSVKLVNMIHTSALGEAHLEMLHEKIDERAVENVEARILHLQPLAVEVQAQLMVSSSSDAIRLRAAQGLNALGGVGAKAQGGGQNYGSKDKIAEIKRLAEERRNGNLVARKTTIEEVYLEENEQTGEEL